MSDHTSDTQNAYQKDGVQYLGKVIELFGGYKKRSFEFLQIAPGLAILDVGCGSGEDALAIAGALGGEAAVTGVDTSEKMLAAANANKAKAGLDAVTFLSGNACALPFDETSFDRVRADRVFQHIETMEEALNEMIRVTKTGGIINVLDIDWSSLLVDATDDTLTRKILSCGLQVVPNPSAGTKLYGLFKRAGLNDVDARAETVCVRDWPIANMIWGLEALANQAAASGVVRPEESAAWIADMEAHSEHEEFFSSITGFMVRGTKG